MFAANLLDMNLT